MSRKKRKIIVFVVLLFGFLIFFGYQFSYKNLKAKKNDENLEAEELAKAIQVKWWVFEVPEEKQNEILGLTFVDASGKESHGGGSGWESGEAKVFIYDLNKKKVGYSVVQGNRVLNGRIKNKFTSAYKRETLNIKSIGSKIAPGDILLKRSKSNEISGSSEVQKKELGLSFTFSD